MKIAILASGEARSLNNLDPNVWAKQFPEHQVDLYCALWDTEVGRRFIKEIKTPAVSKLFDPAFSPMTEFKKEWVANVSNHDTIFNLLDGNLVSKRKNFVLSPCYILRMLFLMREVWRLFEEQQENYDLVIRTRPDNIFNLDLTTLEKNKICFPKKGIDSNFFLGEPEIVKPFMNIWDNRIEIIKEISNIEAVEIIKHVISKFGLDYFFTAHFRIVRQAETYVINNKFRTFENYALFDFVSDTDPLRKIFYDPEGKASIENIINLSFGIATDADKNKYKSGTHTNQTDLEMLNLHRLSLEELENHIKEKKWIENGYHAIHNTFPSILEYKRKYGQ